MLVFDAIELFSRYIKVEKGWTMETHKTYVSWCRSFTRFLETKIERPAQISDLTTQAILDWMYEIKINRHFRPRTIRSTMHALRAFTRYLISINLITEDPCATVKNPKMDAARRIRMRDSDVNAVYAACDRQIDDYKKRLHKAIVSVLIFSGLRRAETADLEIEDIDFEDGCIRVKQGKGKKFRTVYPHPECLQNIRAYLEVRPESHHKWLFLHDKSKRVGDAGLSATLKHLGAIAGYDPEKIKMIQCHTLRHNFSTRLHRAGVELRTIQEILGHSNAITTAIYLASDDERMKQVAHLGALNTLQPPAFAPYMPAPVQPSSPPLPAPTAPPTAPRQPKPTSSAKGSSATGYAW